MKNFTIYAGIGCLAAGLLGIGYAVGTQKKMNQLSDRLDTSLSAIAEHNEVYISDELIDEYVQKAVKSNVERQVRAAISVASNTAANNVKAEMAAQIRDAVNKEYADMSKSVKAKLNSQVAAIDIYSLKNEVRAAAQEKIEEELEDEISRIKDKADEKFNEAVDDVVENVNTKLGSVSKIYEALAKKATGVDTLLQGLT